MKTIVLTGGGTAGHVMPNLALVPALRESGWHVVYIGSYQGIERQLAAGDHIPYHPIATGKLRRYRDRENLKDPFRVLKGVAQSFVLLRRLRPKLVFSKGGFVALPVVVAARLLRVPVILHEADLTLGLANRLALPFADRVAVTFAETAERLPRGRAVYTGLPIRREIFAGDRRKLLSACGFTARRPTLLVTGGSSGAQDLNHAIWGQLPGLLARFQIVHLCGKGKTNSSLADTPGYVQFEYAQDEMPHLLAMSDIVISRAGSNTIFELLALRKPHILVPLPASKSRGDQVLNARLFASRGYSVVVEEERLAETDLGAVAIKLYDERGLYIDRMKKAAVPDGVKAVMDLISSYDKR